MAAHCSDVVWPRRTKDARVVNASSLLLLLHVAAGSKLNGHPKVGSMLAARQDQQRFERRFLSMYLLWPRRQTLQNAAAVALLVLLL